jgi:ribosomal protein L11 methylase PrmA
VFIGSGIIHEQHHEAEAGIRNAGFRSIEVRQREDWIALVCRNG